ncbi:ABC transporter ATP-binding protein [Cytobacillus oceanisediminis]|uniref:ABC transporter ATP-binding protein n=1 Tax=Niallia alba TaxID=2729105 RepID=A0A7Y0K6F1_9BACI|nr:MULTISPECIES: ABC transporter ATP-binding protein [Bacillaceae]EOR25153.1 ABC transporter ATP-binding protein/permease [Niallia nealsonii AAU1]MBQ6446366.1 ABC transporter ATP-binding protein [Bacillus sp. (in: firmicutes)]MDU1845477.1 ABC transporter ATP-binding protein [Niallia nealsonii]MBZ9536347.1 ABC transporter ATP-binding protein [Cytobacillus oceanisediminis]NMO76641.1 ABC transporter ATP-binding protein [Niallia alba]
MTTGKRLFQYALKFKGIIIAALIMLTIAVFADLAGPFVAKKVIDDHITGIESPWYQTEPKKDAVSYNGNFYKKAAYLEADDEKLAEARILQVGRQFLFVEGAISFDGSRKFNDGTLTISRGEEVETYPATALTSSEVFDFYKPEITPILKLLTFYFGLVIISAFFQYGQHYLLQKSANRIIQKMREDVFAHIQRLPIKYFDNLPAGKVVARVTNDTEAIRELYVTVLSNFFSSGINIIGIYIALFILNPPLAAICLILLPILYVWMMGYRKFASRYNHVIRAKISDINGMVNESIQGMHIIQAFSKEKHTRKEFEDLNNEHFRYQNKMLRLNSLTSHNLVNVLRNIVFVVFIWYVAGQSLSATTALSLGVLYAFVDYINRLFQPVQGIVNQLANLEQALVAGERVFELLDEDGIDVQDVTLERYKGNVTFDQVNFAYKDNDYVLRNISFEAMQGETVALVGHTGSGKSSIMNLLFRFYDIQSGRIMIDGKDITSFSKQDLRKYMGIVLQDPFLFTGTIASNVTLNDPSISRETVEKSLKDVGADRVLKHLEKGYDEPVIEKGSTLSSGQRQLISFARALAFDPAILILDEATSSIDTETEQIIQHAMEVLKEGRTTFIIAHRLSTIRNADQILVLDHGQIVEKGNHDELMDRKGKYYQMYQLQQGQDLVS